MVEKAACKEVGHGGSPPPLGSLYGQTFPYGEKLVSSTTLDSCVMENYLRPPDIIKIDVEGENSKSWKAPQGPSVNSTRRFSEIHGTQQHADCRDSLLAKDYSIEESYGQLTATRIPPHDLLPKGVTLGGGPTLFDLNDVRSDLIWQPNFRWLVSQVRKNGCRRRHNRQSPLRGYSYTPQL